jgi:hypothetical protein
MKKFLAIVAVTVFALGILLSVSNDLSVKVKSLSSGPSYASYIPLPPPPPPKPRGC